MSRKSISKVKWTDDMNRDLLECRNEAKDSISSNDPPYNANGRKKGYIEVMGELWASKGYGYLGLKNQNLRDQASRLDKIQCDYTTNKASSSESMQRNESQSIIDSNASFISQENINLQLEYANLATNANLHPNTSQTPEGPNISSEQNETNSHGCLPDYVPANKPTTIAWGNRKDGSTIFIKTSTISDAYNEITTWRKNVFLVPYGRIGKDFIDQITVHIEEWNNQSANHHIALKAVFVLLAIGLQKPSKKSKAKDHTAILEKRLALWKDHKLLQGRIIQGRIKKGKPHLNQDKSKIFAKLVMEGQINSALRYLNESSDGGILPLTSDVMAQLKEKHPKPQHAKLGSLLFGPINGAFPESIYTEIDGDMIRQAALRTKGSGGPSTIDANGFRRILACKSFKQSSSKLCESLAKMTKILCTTYIDPETIEPLVASRLIPLDKGEGAVRPIGVGEVIRRIIGKCVMSVVKMDVIEASGSLQLCAGQKSGNEAAVHAMSTIFEADTSDAVLLIDASNAFNSLNRQAALHNIRILCPPMATFVINTYRHSVRLFIAGGKELSSDEGTTQGDPLAMGIYALSMQPMITALQYASEAKQCWFADDASGIGAINDIKNWWNSLNEYVPDNNNNNNKLYLYW